MPKETQLVQISGYLFLLGVIIAIIAGLAPSVLDAQMVATVLLVLGTIVGLLAIGGWSTLKSDEQGTFLLAVIALMVAGSAQGYLGSLPTIGSYLAPIIGNIAALVAPAAIIIALYTAWRVGAGKLRLMK